ncbi:MAG: hypothetical protein K8U03_08920 [Planctomycetia bacterium]|nr:hypothetical protein [Planctomycetia bacterium]
MIVVAGLTPAWQQIMRFPGLKLGEVNRAAEAVWCASGKVLNVGLALAALGTVSRTISPVGGPARESFERNFAAAGAVVDWIKTDEPTRVCTTLLDESTGVTTELVENARPLSAAELQAYIEAFRKAAADAAIAVFTGSLPGAVATTFYRDLADQTSAKLIVDARGAELLAMFEGARKPFLVKPNREELGKTVRRELATDADLFAAMRELNERGAEWVVVTQGKDAVWASSNREGLYRFTPPHVDRVVNPIGCGDCACAGIAYGLAVGRGVISSIALGMAAATDNLGSLLPARLDKDRVGRIAATITPEKIEPASA